MKLAIIIVFLAMACRLFAPPPPGGSGFVRPLVSNFTGSPSPPASSPAFVDWTNSVAGATTQIRWTNNVASGNSVVVSFGWEDVDYTWAVSDSSGNTYTTLGKTNSGPVGADIKAWAWYSVNVTGGSPLIITATNGSATAALATKGMMIEYSGVTAFDVAGATSTNVNGVGIEQLTGTYNTANAVEALYALGHNYNARTLIQSNIGWSVGYNIGGANMQYFITSSSGTYRGIQTNSGGAHSILFSGALK